MSVYRTTLNLGAPSGGVREGVDMSKHRGERTFLANSVLALVIGVAVALPTVPAIGVPKTTSAVDCPPGYQSIAEELAREPYSDDAQRAELQRQIDEVIAEQGTDKFHADGCIGNKRPEPLMEVMGGQEQRLAMAAAPRNRIPRGSLMRAIRQRNRIARQGQSSSASHKWKRYGNGPLKGDEAGYTSVAGYGLKDLAGRVTSFAYVDPRDRKHGDELFASLAYGGVWRSKDRGQSWKQIGNKLPTQIVGAVGYTRARGGTILALTGDGSFGRYSRTGAGAFYTRNSGRTWKRSRGVPSDAFGFKIAVDQKRPWIVYAATGSGLYRSANAGKSYRNVNLPTGKCKGKSMWVKGCLLANQVTDVVVKVPKGSTNVRGGHVLAAVGWRGGNVENPDGTVQSPRNGLYLGPGKVGTFKKLAAPGFAPQARIGRVELGAAVGPEQDHNYVYAIVQDAVLLRGGTPGLDQDGGPIPSVPTVLNGIYVSSDFGKNWTLMADASELQEPQTGSALAGVAQSSGYGPGIQAWYNEWIQPDPTRQVGGIPTRLLFGLEEVWMNEQTNAPQTGKSQFRVVGRYYAGDSCLFLQTGLPVCPTDRDDPATSTTTTHPDQQAATFIPSGEGGATLIVGNDGGVYRQVVDAGEDYANTGWGKGAQKNLHTLLPYDAVIAKDGTVYAGLQDNGNMKIADVRKKGKIVDRKRQIMVYGGDGFFVGVDPHNSKVAYEEYTYGAMNATKDGGKTWTGMSPPGLDGTTAQFSTPFVVDPKDPNHVMIAGNQVDETGSGPGTSSSDWAVVYDLGTSKRPGNKNAEPTQRDPINSMTAIDMRGSKAYVGYCGECGVLNAKTRFKSGLATNVGGAKSPKRYTSRGWHIADAIGLPDRYITSVALVPKKAKKVYVGVGGYQARWLKPNALDKNPNVGKGHLFVSNDAGDHFKDISGNLPNTPINWLTRRAGRIIVATDVGIFITKPGTSCRKGCKFELLGRGLPRAPVFTVRVAACDKNLLTAAVYGRGVYTYRFGPKPRCPKPKVPPPPAFKGQKVAGPFDFETGPEGWTPEGPAQGNWKVSPPGDASSQSYNVMPYTDEGTFELVSPKFTLAKRSSIKLSWSEARDTEPCCDYMSVEWTTDGYVWHSARAVAGQNPGYPTFAPAETKFVAPAGKLQIRFRLTSDALVSAPAYQGVAVDKILIER